jgi:hypothetical protein
MSLPPSSHTTHLALLRCQIERATNLLALLVHAAATTSRHICRIDALKARCGLAEGRWPGAYWQFGIKTADTVLIASASIDVRSHWGHGRAPRLDVLANGSQPSPEDDSGLISFAQLCNSRCR